ncbi:MAG: TetR/AcrR family transcriptional regulator, partial [Microbacterium chocolatum]|nr:TetR/AcrR family transcriptional regulator [Microbacterium chocolatum]
QQVFEELVIDLNRRVRRSMAEAMAGATDRISAERAGFEGFFRFTAAHPALYRVVREAEFVSPETLRLHYTRIVEGYESGLRAAQADGDVDEALDPEVTAWALMGAGELIGMRYLLWERDADGAPPAEMPASVVDDMARFIRNALSPRARTEGPA